MTDYEDLLVRNSHGGEELEFHDQRKVWFVAKKVENMWALRHIQVAKPDKIFDTFENLHKYVKAFMDGWNANHQSDVEEAVEQAVSDTINNILDLMEEGMSTRLLAAAINKIHSK